MPTFIAVAIYPAAGNDIQNARYPAAGNDTENTRYPVAGNYTQNTSKRILNSVRLPGIMAFKIYSRPSGI